VVCGGGSGGCCDRCKTGGCTGAGGEDSASDFCSSSGGCSSYDCCYNYAIEGFARG
jgi:hypothetical protein